MSDGGGTVKHGGGVDVCVSASQTTPQNRLRGNMKMRNSYEIAWGVRGRGVSMLAGIEDMERCGLIGELGRLTKARQGRV